jgi:DNA-binding IclR family transcriptional regulator
VSRGRRYTIAAAVKTLEVLFAFRDARGALSLTEVSSRAQLPRNQVYRCLKSLEAMGLLAEQPRGFALTPKLLELVPAIRGQSLLSAAEPAMHALQEATGETVNLVALLEAEDETVCLVSVPTRHGIGLLTRVGQRSGLHAGACPKAILAFMPVAVQERVLAGLKDAVRYTDATVLDANRLREELRETAARGYSITDEDFEAGARGVGAAIFGPSGGPVGGLSVGGPASRVDDEKLRRFGALAVEAAREVSSRLGGVPIRTLPEREEAAGFAAS